MRRLPLLLSVPHAGLEAPPEAIGLHALGEEEIAADGDVGAAEVYLPLEDEAAALVATPVARAFVDCNRAPDDLSKDGVVKTHTCWDVPVWREPLPDGLVRRLVERHWHPYHERLSTAAARGGLVLGVDCHTMAATGPPVGPDPGRERPAACLSHADGTCPDEWIASLRDLLAAELGRPVSINDPFTGGYLTRTHAAEMPWLQLELSRAGWISNAEKQRAVRAALGAWCERHAAAG